LPPNTGWIFNYDCSGEYITGEAAHRRATCGNTSNPCNIKGASVIAVRGQRVVVDGTSANRVKGEGFGQSRPVVLMSVLGGDSSQRRPRFCRSKPSIRRRYWILAPSPHAPFTVVIYGDNRSKFGTPETSLRGKRICVTGQISDYRGKPEIVLTDPNQLTQ